MKKLRRRVEKFNGLCVGLDLHKKFIQVSVLDELGDEIEADALSVLYDHVLGDRDYGND